MTAHGLHSMSGIMSTLARPALASVRTLPPLILAALAAVWLIWGSTYLAIKWALVSFPPF